MWTDFTLFCMWLNICSFIHSLIYSFIDSFNHSRDTIELSPCQALCFLNVEMGWSHMGKRQIYNLLTYGFCQKCLQRHFTFTVQITFRVSQLPLMKICSEPPSFCCCCWPDCFHHCLPCWKVTVRYERCQWYKYALSVCWNKRKKLYWTLYTNLEKNIEVFSTWDFLKWRCLKQTPTI